MTEAPRGDATAVTLSADSRRRACPRPPMFCSLHVCTAPPEPVLLFAHDFCAPPRGAPPADAYEGALADALADAPAPLLLAPPPPGAAPPAPGAPAAGGGDYVAAVAGRLVVVRAFGGLLFCLAGGPGADEAALADALPGLAALVAATCDGRLTPAQLVAFHGKVAVCLAVACPGGALRHTDVQAVLKLAKLKSSAGA